MWGWGVMSLVYIADFTLDTFLLVVWQSFLAKLCKNCAAL